MREGRLVFSSLDLHKFVTAGLSDVAMNHTTIMNDESGKWLLLIFYDQMLSVRVTLAGFNVIAGWEVDKKWNLLVYESAVDGCYEIIDSRLRVNKIYVGLQVGKKTITINH